MINLHLIFLYNQYFPQAILQQLKSKQVANKATYRFTSYIFYYYRYSNNFFINYENFHENNLLSVSYILFF